MMNLLEMSRQNIVFRSCCHILLQCLSRFHLAKTLVNKNAKGGVLSGGMWFGGGQRDMLGIGEKIS